MKIPGLEAFCAKVAQAVQDKCIRFPGGAKFCIPNVGAGSPIEQLRMMLALIALALVPLVLVVMNLAYTAVAYPAGIAADRGHRRTLLVWGLAALIAADLVLGATTDRSLFFVAIVLWGAHMGLTQGLLSTMVADAAPAELRGTAFGVFHLVSGGALLAASVIAGGLWSSFGASWTFHAGAAFTALALVGMLLYRPA